MTALLRRVAGLLVLTALVPTASAQRMHTERVRFARGESTAYSDMSYGRGVSMRYLVGVRRGQTLTAEMQEGGPTTRCTFEVYAPGRAIRESNAAPGSDGTRTRLTRWTGTLSRAGDYQIVVTNRDQTGGCGIEIGVD